MVRRGRLIIRARERIMHQAFCIVRVSGQTVAEWLTADDMERIRQSGGSVEKF